jgi:hypothetical protein
LQQLAVERNRTPITFPSKFSLLLVIITLIEEKTKAREIIR